MTLGTIMAHVRGIVEARRGKPVVHENGFIQLPLDPLTRLHVWPDGPVNRQKTESPIHDHRFAFESVVIAGVLDHVEWEWRGDHVHPTHQVYQVVNGKLEGTIDVGFMKVRDRLRLVPGSTYTFGPRRFHTSSGNGLTATVMLKTRNYPEFKPRVMVPIGQVPDNDYDRETANDPDVLWEYIRRAVSSG